MIEIIISYTEFLLVFVVIIFFIFSFWRNKKKNNLGEAIKKILNNSQYKFNYIKEINNELANYKKLPLIRKSFLGNFIINGIYKGENFTYFQVFSNLQQYSVLIFDAEKYDPKFDFIHITPQTILNFGTDYDLEWIKFNKNFINKFDDPREALEVVTPYFMDLLVDLKNKYGFVEIQYFTDNNYQKESLILIKKEYIFPIFLFKKERMENYFKNFLDYLDSGFNLKNSI